jgi:hypothetical protein
MIAVVACLASVAVAADYAGAAAAPKNGAIRVGVIELRQETVAPPADARVMPEEPGTQTKAVRSALPADLGGRQVEVRTVLLGRDHPELEAYRVVVLPPQWTEMLPKVDEHAAAFHRYVKRGGGLVVFQPNPMVVYPPGASPSPALAARGITTEFCTVKLLPLAVTFYNRYDKDETPVRAATPHPLIDGLEDDHMPFPADQLYDLDAAWVVLARGSRSNSPSLAAAKVGDGRVVLIADNVDGGMWARPLTVVKRGVLWAAGASDEEVRKVTDPLSPPWPDAAAAEAIRAGTLRLNVTDLPAAVNPVHTVDMRAELVNSGRQGVGIPRTWLDMLGVEVFPAKGGADGVAVWTWMPEVSKPGLRNCWALSGDGGSTGVRPVRSWFMFRELKGRPKDSPFLSVGKYRIRMVLCVEPMLASPWRDLEVVPPPPPAPDAGAAAVAARRPGGRCLIVEADRPSILPDGSAGNPFADVAAALRQAKAGDTVYCRPGLHRGTNLTVPDGVWLVGRAAAETALVVTGTGNNGPGLELCGQSRLEGLTVTGGGNRAIYMIRATGQAARPTLFQCMLLPDNSAFSGLVAWDHAAPTVRNCLIVSPRGDYGVFARQGAKPVLEYCTIISRGFGVGMMDGAAPVIRRCIIAGQVPAIICDKSSEFALSDSVLWAPAPAGAAHDGLLTGDGASIAAVRGRKDILLTDPKFTQTARLAGLLSIADSSDARAYGAYAGDGGRWPTPQGPPPAGLVVPEVRACLGLPPEGKDAGETKVESPPPDR